MNKVLFRVNLQNWNSMIQYWCTMGRWSGLSQIIIFFCEKETDKDSTRMLSSLFNGIYSHSHL